MLGLEHVLTSMVTASGGTNAIDTPEARERLADLFVEHMFLIGERTPETAARKAIALAAATVARDASAEGIELELLRIEAAPTAVFKRPDRKDRRRQLFYVHVLMPDEQGGVLTESGYFIHADDADEFAEYVRDRTLPEIRELIVRYGGRSVESSAA